MSTFGNVQINGKVTQSQPAQNPFDLIRLQEAQQLVLSLLAGNWNNVTTYTQGQLAVDGNSLYILNGGTSSLNQQPSLNPGVWNLVLSGGTNGTAGDSVYIAFASDTNGTGYSTTPTSGLNFVAFLQSATAPTGAASFAGLWQQFVGAAGATGTAGSAGTAGASAFVYIGYASDTSGTNYSATPSPSLNYVAILSSTVAITSLTSANFTGLWKQYGSGISSVSSPLTLTSGVLGINASSANTASYVVQRDASGNFSAGAVTATSVIVGSATLSYSSSALQVNTPMVVTGLTVGSLSGVLQATGGAVTGGATTDNLPQGSTNLYFTTAQVLATKLTGLTSTNVLLTSDSIIVAFSALDNIIGGNFPAGTVSGNFTITGNLAVTGTTTLGTLNGILQANNGLITGGATADNLPVGTTNLYWTQALFNTAIGNVRGATNGVAPLDSNSKVPLANLYAYGATPWGAASQAAMLALSSAKQGDFCLRSDTNIVYVLSNNTPSVLSNWTAFVYPVSSVNGATGTVTLTTDSVPIGSTNLYWTQTLFNTAITAIKNAANGICPLNSSSQVPAANLPPLGNSLWTANSQSVQTNLTTALMGDLCNRTDQNLTYILTNNTPTSFSSWTPLLSPVSSVNGATGAVVLSTTNVAEGTNLYFTTTRVLATTLTGFTAGVGTVTSSDTVLSALQKVAANAAAAVQTTGGAGGIMSGTLTFSGTANAGLIVNQLSTGQISALATTSGNYGNIVYDTTAQQLKALVNGAFVVLSSGASVPLSGGSGTGQKMTGTLYFQDGLSLNLQLGNVWGMNTTSSNANFNILNSSTYALVVDSSNVVHAPNGYFDTPNGYKINGTNWATLSGSQLVITMGGNFIIGTTGSYATMQLGYNGTSLVIDQSSNVSIQNSGVLKMGANKVIDASNYFYDQSGHQILAGQQGAIANFSPVGGWTDSTAYSDFSNLVNSYNTLLAEIRAHGLIAT